MSQVLKDITATRDLLEKGWIKKQYYGMVGDQRCYCLVGGLDEVCATGGSFAPVAILQTFFVEESVEHPMYAAFHYNDESCRTKDEVLSMLDRAIMWMQRDKFSAAVAEVLAQAWQRWNRGCDLTYQPTMSCLITEFSTTRYTIERRLLILLYNIGQRLSALPDNTFEVADPSLTLEQLREMTQSVVVDKYVLMDLMRTVRQHRETMPCNDPQK